MGVTVAEAMLTEPKVCDRSTTAADLSRLFEDEHMHAALIVQDDVLISVVVPADLMASTSGTATATGLGQLRDRVIHGCQSLDDAKQRMLTLGQRRLAVIDHEGRLLGLLCLNRNHTGFCTDREVQARAAELNRSYKRASTDRRAN